MLTPEEVAHIARLARVRLTGAEVEKFRKELSAILEFVKKLNEVDVGGVPPASHITGLGNVLRSDEPSCIPERGGAGRRERLLDQAPDREGDYVRVKAVFE